MELRVWFSSSIVVGITMFFVGSLPVFLLAYASFQVSAEIILTWIVHNLCQYLAAGIAVGIVADRMAAHRSV